MPREQRRRHLWRSKCFTCICERCIVLADSVRDIPCRQCEQRLCGVTSWRVVHKPCVWMRALPSTDSPRVGLFKFGEVFNATGRTEDRWAELSSEKGWVLTDGREIGLGELCTPESRLPDQPAFGFWDHYRRYFFGAGQGPDPKYCAEDLFEVALKSAADLALPRHCVSEPRRPLAYARFEGDCWRCRHCGHEDRNQALLHTERALSRLAERTFFNPEMAKCSADLKAHLLEDEFLAGALDIAELVTVVLGHQHWAAQWARILFTDIAGSLQTLSNHTCFIREPLGDLCVLWDWLKSLGLAQSPSCWLHQRMQRFDALGLPANSGPDIHAAKAEVQDHLCEEQHTVTILPVKNYVLRNKVSLG